jgi:hypothetical protein
MTCSSHCSLANYKEAALGNIRKTYSGKLSGLQRKDPRFTGKVRAQVSEE